VGLGCKTFTEVWDGLLD